MRELVSYLSIPRDIAEPKQRAAQEHAAQHIERAFRDAGLAPGSDPYLAGGFVERNLEVELAGKSEGAFVIGTRYDTEASGVAVLIELAMRLSRGGVTPKHTLRLVTFGGKTGSEVYAARSKVRGEELSGMIELDGLGGATKPLSVIGNLRSRSLAKQLASALEAAGPVRQRSWLLPARSSAFAEEGWPAVRVTDGVRRAKTTAVDYARLERIASALVDFVR